MKTGYAVFQGHVTLNKLEMNIQLLRIARDYFGKIFWKYLRQWPSPFVLGRLCQPRCCSLGEYHTQFLWLDLFFAPQCAYLNSVPVLAWARMYH